MVDINDNRNRGSGLIVDRRELLTGAAALGSLMPSAARRASMLSVMADG